MALEVIIGDLHLDKKHKVTYGDAAIWDNLSLKRLNTAIRLYRPKRLILLGDVFDTSNPPAKVVVQFLKAIENIEQVYIIAGNHDIPMLKGPTVFSELQGYSNIKIVEPNSVVFAFGYAMLGWHDTQELFETNLRKAIQNDPAETILVHASRHDFGNKNDNTLTEDLLYEAKKKGKKIISGHEHSSYISNDLIYLGSVVPHTISELGIRYILVDGELVPIEDEGEVVITREEPELIEEGVVYAIRPKKEITLDDLVLEDKDLTIDILASFWAEAEKRGFTKEILL